MKSCHFVHGARSTRFGRGTQGVALGVSALVVMLGLTACTGNPSAPISVTEKPAASVLFESQQEVDSAPLASTAPTLETSLPTQPEKVPVLQRTEAQIRMLFPKLFETFRFLAFTRFHVDGSQNSKAPGQVQISSIEPLDFFVHLSNARDVPGANTFSASALSLSKLVDYYNVYGGDQIYTPEQVLAEMDIWIHRKTDPLQFQGVPAPNQYVELDARYQQDQEVQWIQQYLSREDQRDCLLYFLQDETYLFLERSGRGGAGFMQIPDPGSHPALWMILDQDVLVPLIGHTPMDPEQRVLAWLQLKPNQKSQSSNELCPYFFEGLLSPEEAEPLLARAQ